MTACAWLTPRALVELPPPPAELMEPCPDLRPLPDGRLATVVRTLVADAKLYRDCQDKQARLAALLQFQRTLKEIDDAE